MKIQKLETGGVLLIDDQDQVIRSMPANVFLQTTDNLVTVYIGDSKVSLFPNSITETQVLPDAPIPFNGYLQSSGRSSADIRGYLILMVSMVFIIKIVHSHRIKLTGTI